MHISLEIIAIHSIAKASPHDKVWFIVCNASDSRLASPNSWCRLNLQSNAFELTENCSTRTPLVTNCQTPWLQRKIYIDGTGFENDPITHFRLDESPLNTPIPVT